MPHPPGVRTPPPLAFPHFVGPGTRDLSTALLFNDHLVLALPGWPSAGPNTAFHTVCEHALATNHSLAQLFRAVAHLSGLALTRAITEQDGMQALRGHLTFAMVLSPGTSAAYESWEPVHANCLPFAFLALRDPVFASSASVEFIFRVYELCLELGMDPDSPESLQPDPVLRALAERAAKLGSDSLLLAECGLNRILVPSSSKRGSFATSSKEAVAILQALALTEAQSPGPRERAESLAFLFFDNLLRPYAPQLSPIGSERIADLLGSRADALETMRATCRARALEVVASPPPEQLYSRVVEETFRSMEAEARDVAQVDSAAFRTYVKDLAQDEKVWATVAGLAGSAVSMPGLLTASLAIGAASLVGAKAVKSSFERAAKVEKSPWAFVYYAATR
jgi:hypothetical protein